MEEQKTFEAKLKDPDFDTCVNLVYIGKRKNNQNKMLPHFYKYSYENQDIKVNTNEEISFSSQFYVEEYHSDKVPIGTALQIIKFKSGRYFGVAKLNQEHTKIFMRDTNNLTQWSTEQRFHNSFVRIKKENDVLWKQNLDPVRDIYRKTKNYADKEKIISIIINYITS